MKKLIVLLLAFAMVFSLAACGGGEEEAAAAESPKAEDPAVETTVSEETEPESEDIVEPAEEIVEPKEFEVQTISSGDFEITVLGAERIAGRDDVPAIRIYYQFTNNASYTAKAVDDLYFETLQNGESIGVVHPGSRVPEDAFKELYVRPGTTVRCTSVRELLDETSPVTFTVGAYTSEEVLEVEFDLANLPGAPTEPLEVVAVADPQSLAGLATEGLFDEKYNVAITGVEKTTDQSGNDALAVHYSYTNNSDAAKSFLSAVSPKAFQDGIEMSQAIPADVTAPAFAMRAEKCEPGQTVEVDLFFELTSASPCEVEVCDTHISMETDEYFEDRIGLIYVIE